MNCILDGDSGYAWFSMGVKWNYECVEVETEDKPATWRVFPENDDSYEATICELWSGEYDNEQLCKEICAAHNATLTPDGIQRLVLQPSGVEIIIEPRADGKWEMVNAKHYGDEG